MPTVLDFRQMSPAMIEVCNAYEAKARLTILEDDTHQTHPTHQTPNTKPHVCKTAQRLCNSYGALIEREQQYTQHTTQTGYGYPEGPHYSRVWKHYPECPKKEGPV
ncbi:hypothetical protein [Candidatus Bathycorpusculum sp.]|uniref:hypothetical protein n=1 Tax=Candidatus Bathycorpusculum sp. TaxID=2994959 RepID=UPI00281CFF38|nr:hypothetical protein [Candidatus Termitimicrobium sp.]MCL2432070.1 hypothetical protein [Candidatus Termitimicrobium sp.]